MPGTQDGASADDLRKPDRAEAFGPPPGVAPAAATRQHLEEQAAANPGLAERAAAAAAAAQDAARRDLVDRDHGRALDRQAAAGTGMLAAVEAASLRLLARRGAGGGEVEAARLEALAAGRWAPSDDLMRRYADGTNVPLIASHTVGYNPPPVRAYVPAWSTTILCGSTALALFMGPAGHPWWSWVSGVLVLAAGVVLAVVLAPRGWVPKPPPSPGRWALWVLEWGTCGAVATALSGTPGMPWWALVSGTLVMLVGLALAWRGPGGVFR